MAKDYGQECELCKIFSNSNRLKILMCLGKEKMTVSGIIHATHLPQSVVSQHLSMMKMRNILDTEKNGSFVIYRIKYPEILDALNIMEEVKEKINK